MTQAGYACPRCGQTSSESDFCSECGARIGAERAVGPSVGLVSDGATSSEDPNAAGTGAGFGECPACHTPRPSPDARFCEVCRYDFLKQVAGGPPVLQLKSAQAGAAAVGSDLGSSAPIVSHGAATLLATAPSQQLTPAIEAAPATVSVPRPPQPSVALAPANGMTWDVVIAVDPSLDTDPDPELTAPDDPERRIPLDRAENLIGRRDAKQAIVPDIRPNDPSVSRRHAKLLVHSDGTVAILDLDSANGTFVNGEQILGGVPCGLTADDVVTIGRWTRLRIQPRGMP